MKKMAQTKILPPDPRWHQPTPVMELTAIVMSLEGEFRNWQESIVSAGHLAEQLEDHIDQLKALAKFMSDREGV